MSFHAHLLPADRQFEVAGGETLLEAGLRAGLAMNYGCSNGNCGLCKARLLAGDVRKVRAHDYVLSAAEKQQAVVLLCCCTAASDVELEAGVATRPAEIPLQEISARVKEIRPLTDKVRLLHLQTPRTNRLRFLAGQSVALSIDEDVSAAYAIASCPCDDRNLQFHVRNVAGNAFAQRVFDGLRPGATVTVYGPVGEFALKPDPAPTIVMLACNSGFAPIKSLAEHAMSLEVAESLHLYWLATVVGGHYMANWCRAWADALDNFHYHELADDALSPAALERVVARVVADQANLAGLDVYAAGPPVFLEGVRAGLLTRGVEPASLISALT
jgi:CDP-4-dehydro-6-deoxyglucose reductase